ncbi:Metallo-dependent phosphatase-like protein [Polychytrium aggregatum]|uniref:Metallo-dependent phosphatase-like protein n=1 Tax=Polychytrium aggregatum TaxID=110093 RepID=UPI0022FE15DF|nr:Metallo-dependent phosphatase-like protein [Polychytrium aggregatum]KAI9206747.1 Metallo-dependent phosphatase-like protein [Polychytrium aggregatum]
MKQIVALVLGVAALLGCSHVADAREVPSKPAPARVVAVGDFHSDYPSTLKVLMLANITDKNGDWVGGSTTFVQTGDVVDRGPDTIKLYDMMRRLQKQAKEAGGRVVPLLGNHEVMNMANDLRYVTPEDFASFGGDEQRAHEWSAKGELGSWLRGLGITTKVGGTVFVHGGIHPSWARHGVRKLNEMARAALTLPPDQIHRQAIFDGKSPIWYRGYASNPEATECAVLEQALNYLGAKRMVVGHTPQQSGKILKRCGGKVFVIDVGISRYYGFGYAALEILNDETVNALYPDNGHDEL